MIHGRRSILAAALIVSALAAAAPPAQARQAEVTTDRTAVGSPPDFPTYTVTLVQAEPIDLVQLLSVSHRIDRDTGMAKALSLDSLVRVDSVTSIDSAGRAPDIRQRHVLRNDTSSLNSDSTSTVLPATVYRSSVLARTRLAVILSNYQTAQSAHVRGRTIGHDAFPLYL